MDRKIHNYLKQHDNISQFAPSMLYIYKLFAKANIFGYENQLHNAEVTQRQERTNHSATIIGL